MSIHGRVQFQGARIIHGLPLWRCPRVPGGGPGWAAGGGAPPGSPPGLAGPALAGRGLSCGCAGAQGPSGRPPQARNLGMIPRGHRSGPNPPWEKKTGGPGAQKSSTHSLRTWAGPQKVYANSTHLGSACLKPGLRRALPKCVEFA